MNERSLSPEQLPIPEVEPTPYELVAIGGINVMRIRGLNNLESSE